jgi:hypothetical protein
MYPPVNSIMFQLGPLAVHWYGLTMVTAIFVAAAVASNYVSRHGQTGHLWAASLSSSCVPIPGSSQEHPSILSMFLPRLLLSVRASPSICVTVPKQSLPLKLALASLPLQ